jgi:metal-sulfur cluster biosynthetic enzyme
MDIHYETPTVESVTEKLMTVYDPEFPLVDIYTMGLIYQIHIDQFQNLISIVMTLTSPACPAADIIQEMMKNVMIELNPYYTTQIELTFDPMRTIEMIKDEDLQRMFM